MLIKLNIINDNIKQFNEWTVTDIIGLIQEENQKFLERVTQPNIQPMPNNDLLQTLLHKIENLENTNKHILEQLSKKLLKAMLKHSKSLFYLLDINMEYQLTQILYSTQDFCLTHFGKRS